MYLTEVKAKRWSSYSILFGSTPIDKGLPVLVELIKKKKFLYRTDVFYNLTDHWLLLYLAKASDFTLIPSYLLYGNPRNV